MSLRAGPARTTGQVSRHGQQRGWGYHQRAESPTPARPTGPPISLATVLKRPLHVGIALLLIAVVVVPAGAQTSAQTQLDAAKARLAAIAEQVKDAEGVVASNGVELQRAEDRLDEVEAVVNAVAIQLEEQTGRVAAAQNELSRLRVENDRVQAKYDSRIAAIYKGVGPRDLDIVLSSTDISVVIGRANFLEVVNTADTASLQDLRASREQVRTQQERLAGERVLLEDFKAEQEVVLAQVQEIRDSRYLSLVDAQAQVGQLAREQDDVEAESKQLEEIIREATGPAPVISAPSSGGYVWPLCGSLSSDYGRRWGRLHKGLDIDDNRTKAIVAAKAGRVIFASYSGGYGNLTLIQHNDGVVTAYAHQAAIAVGVGAQVSTGQRIGTVGTTGSSTGTHLHFETRVNGGAVNPRRYLSGNGC